MTDEEIQAAICDEGPYVFDRAQSDDQFHAWWCQACGAKVRREITVTNPSWAHEKPWARDEPKRSTETVLTIAPSASSGTTCNIGWAAQALSSGAMLGSRTDFPYAHMSATTVANVTPTLTEDRVRALIAEAIDGAEDRMVERVCTLLVNRLRTN